MKPATRQDTTIPPGRAAAALALLVLVLLGLFWHFAVAQVHYVWHHLGDWGHTLVVPLVTGWLIWMERDRLLARPFATAPAGLLLILLGLVAYLATLFGPGFLQLHNARAIGVALTLFGVAVTGCGWSAMRVLWFPLLYLVAFGQYLSPQVLAPVTERLQDLAAGGAHVMFELLGYETTRVGSLLTLDRGGSTRPLDVAEACSGMRMLMAFLALGTFIAWTGLPALWQRVVLVLLGVPIAIVVNILRITTQGILDGWDTGFTVGAAHSTISLIWLVPALLLFLFFMWLLEPFAEAREEPAPEGPPTVVVTASTRTTWFAMIGLLLVAAIGVHVVANTSGLRSVKSAAPLRSALDALPTRLGDWERVGEDLRFEDTVLATLGTTLHLDRVYARSEGPDAAVLQLHVAYYTGGATARPHVPERCWAVQGLTEIRDPVTVALPALDRLWSPGAISNRATGERYPVVVLSHPVTGVAETVHLPVGPHAMRVTLFADPLDPSLRLVGGYLFIANGRLTPNASAVRRLAYNFGDTHAYFCKVQVGLLDAGSPLDDDELIERFERLVEELLAELMPELMRLLPDWPEYEQRSETD